MSLRWAWVCIAWLALSVAACRSDDQNISRASAVPSADPAGARAKVLDNPLHKTHLAGTTPLLCTDCHQAIGTSFEMPAREVCLGCHVDQKSALHGDALPCTECHAFAAEPAPKNTECQRCHKTAQGEAFAIKAHAKVECQNCHEPHESPSLAIRNCLDCHEDHQQNHGIKGLSTIDRCSQCHTPHAQSIEAVTLCESCHKDKLVRGVFRGHDKCDTCHQGDLRSAPSKPMACTSCHKDRVTLSASKVVAHAKCENCHAPHDPRGTAIQSCRRCHSDVTPKHPGQGKNGLCVGCHTVHPKSISAPLASACSSCHKEARADDMLHAPKKITCSQCHSQHEFKPPTCASCHSKELVLTKTIPAHKDCTSCHVTAHAPKASMSACASCHTAEYESAPTGHKACAQCHEPHSGKRLPTAQCSSCHKEKSSQTHGRIAGGCQNCHRAHGPRGVAKPPSCQSCHERKALPALHAVAKHNECATCHRGHGMAELNRATCLTGCHADRVDHEPVVKTCVGCHPFGASR